MEREPHILRKSVWQQFKKSRSAMFAIIFMAVLTFVSLFAELISNDRPLTAIYKGKRVYPVFTPNKIDSTYLPASGSFKTDFYEFVKWDEVELESAIWPLIPYGTKARRKHRLFSPLGKQIVKNTKTSLKGRQRHWFGTNRAGQDVLAGVLRGARVSLAVGILAVLISSIIGVFIGSMAGFLGDQRVKIRRAIFLMAIPGLILAWFYGFRVRRFVLIDAFSENWISGIGALGISFLIGLGVFLLLIFLGRIIGRKSYFGNYISLPIDHITMRSIEVINSIPSLLLIISVAMILGRSLWVVMLILGLTSWTGVARLVRAEMLKISRMEYIESAKALGIKEFSTLFRHALPNALTPVWVVMAFGIGNAIIAESALSFLKIIDHDLTWGSMLSEGKANISAWWMSVFPGLAIFFTVLSFNLLGERLRDILDPKQRT